MTDLAIAAATSPAGWVVAANLLLAALIWALAGWLWQWRSQLVALALWLALLERERSVAPGQMRYALTLKRAQIATTRLDVARWQRSVRQIRQIVKLVRWLRLLLFYGIAPRRQAAFLAGRSASRSAGRGANQ